MSTAWRLYQALSEARQRRGWWPWSICIETSAPVIIDGKLWEPCRSRLRMDGRMGYGYSRAQVSGMLDALDWVLRVQIDKSTEFLRVHVRDLDDDAAFEDGDP